MPALQWRINRLANPGKLRILVVHRCFSFFILLTTPPGTKPGFFYAPLLPFHLTRSRGGANVSLILPRFIIKFFDQQLGVLLYFEKRIDYQCNGEIKHAGDNCTPANKNPNHILF
jgi:hypothetical protein